MKYWNAGRIRRKKERERQKQIRLSMAAAEADQRARRYTRGDARKNARLMLEALGNPLRRRMLARLQSGGAMSLSQLARPFHLMLPNALKQMAILERSGLITTHKRGRIRFCVLNPDAAEELSRWFDGRRPFETG